jgi:hypothetical protein
MPSTAIPLIEITSIVSTNTRSLSLLFINDKLPPARDSGKRYLQAMSGLAQGLLEGPIPFLTRVSSGFTHSEGVLRTVQHGFCHQSMTLDTVTLP